MFFISFFQFYGNDFDFTLYQISLEDGGTLIRKRGRTTDNELCVVDVTNEDNNLGKNYFDYLRIKNLYYRIYFFIKNTPINNAQSYLTPFIFKKDLEVLISEDDI